MRRASLSLFDPPFRDMLKLRPSQRIQNFLFQRLRCPHAKSDRNYHRGVEVPFSVLRHAAKGTINRDSLS
jgi:hypothetical protein